MISDCLVLCVVEVVGYHRQSGRIFMESKWRLRTKYDWTTLYGVNGIASVSPIYTWCRHAVC